MFPQLLPSLFRILCLLWPRSPGGRTANLRGARSPSYAYPGAAVIVGCLVTVLLSRVPARAADPETEAGKLLGKTLSAAFSEQAGRTRDPLLEQWVQRIGDSVVAQSPRRNLPYHLAILDSEEPNAFTLPGGYIFVTRGLLDFVQSPDELAGVIAHETGHVVYRHPMRLIEWQTGASLLARFGPFPHSDLANVLEQSGVFLVTLQLSREAELAADRYGIRAATAAGYDPAGLVQFLRGLGVNRTPGFMDRYLATHPPNVDRIRALEKTVYMDPRDAVLQEDIGDHLVAACRPAAAIPHYQNALADRPGDPNLAAKLDQARLALGEGAPPPSPSAAIPAPTPRPGPPGTPHPAADSTPAPGIAPAQPVGAAPESPAPDASAPAAGGVSSEASAPAAEVVSADDAASALHTAQDATGRPVIEVNRSLRRLVGFDRADTTLRDALLGVGTNRLGDVKWLALAYQAYSDVGRLNDLFSRVVHVDVRVSGDLGGMEREVADAPSVLPFAGETRADAVKIAREAEDSVQAMRSASAHLSRGVVLVGAILADLDSVFFESRRTIGLVRSGTVEAALLAVEREIDLGRKDAARSQARLALAEDRLLVARINRLGQAAGERRLSLYDCNAAALLRLPVSRMRDLRTADSYGNSALKQALSVELGKAMPDIEAGLPFLTPPPKPPNAQVGPATRVGPITQIGPAIPVGPTGQGQPDSHPLPVTWTDAVLSEGGSPGNVEIILRQLALAMQEES